MRGVYYNLYELIVNFYSDFRPEYDPPGVGIVVTDKDDIVPLAGIAEAIVGGFFMHAGFQESIVIRNVDHNRIGMRYEIVWDVSDIAVDLVVVDNIQAVDHDDTVGDNRIVEIDRVDPGQIAAGETAHEEIAVGLKLEIHGIDLRIGKRILLGLVGSDEIRSGFEGDSRSGGIIAAGYKNGHAEC